MENQARRTFPGEPLGSPPSHSDGSMIQVFGLTLPTSSRPADDELVAILAGQIAAAAAALKGDAPAALFASVRRDTRRYLDARRNGQLRMPKGATSRACDEGALVLMRLTLNAPPISPNPELLVA
jgi:hypothetical protein